MSKQLPENEVIRNAWQRGMDALKPSQAELDRGLELHERVFACDTFGFLPSIFTQEVVDKWNELKALNVGGRALRWESSLVRETAPTRDEAGAGRFVEAILASGLNGMVQTVAEGKSREQDIKRMSMSLHNIRVLSKYMAHCGSADELREAREHGRMGVVWSVNGPPMPGLLEDLAEELSWVQTWYNLGVRLMHLTYNRRNVVGDGCAEPANGGLSDLGFELVREMNRVGIVVDVPHSGRQTTLDAAHASEKPMMASHTGARAVYDHMRCKSDEELRAIAETDGLIGVYVLPNMLGPDADINKMLDHVDYIAKLVGTRHLAIGTDTRYQDGWPAEISGYEKSRFDGRWWGNWKPDNHPLPVSDEASRGSLAWTNFPLYTVGLAQRGYSDEDIANILGENFLRVLDANRPEKEVRV